MCYIPGPKAETEYKAFNRKHLIAEEVLQESDIGSRPQETTPPDNPLLQQARELVRSFHHCFHGIEHATPQPKELDQAMDLITQYGFDRAKYLVEFSQSAAAETNYHPQTFGGILQYTARALAEYEKFQTQQQVREAIQNCPFCNSNGLIIFEDAEGNSFAWQCTHDPHVVEDLERQRGVKRV